MIDALYVLYMRNVADKKALRAASFGSLIHILTAFTVISYTQDIRYIVPLVLGSFLGAYITVKYIS